MMNDRFLGLLSRENERALKTARTIERIATNLQELMIEQIGIQSQGSDSFLKNFLLTVKMYGDKLSNFKILNEDLETLELMLEGTGEEYGWAREFLDFCNKNYPREARPQIECVGKMMKIDKAVSDIWNKIEGEEDKEKTKKILADKKNDLEYHRRELGCLAKKTQNTSGPLALWFEERISGIAQKLASLRIMTK